jgi:Ring finger domain
VKESDVSIKDDSVRHNLGRSDSMKVYVMHDAPLDSAASPTAQASNEAGSNNSISPSDTGKPASVSNVSAQAAGMEYEVDFAEYSSVIQLPCGTMNGNRSVPGVCAICLGAYEAGERISWSPDINCQHVFHSDCIIEWLAKKEEPRCPVCRQIYCAVPPAPPNPFANQPGQQFFQYTPHFSPAMVRALMENRYTYGHTDNNSIIINLGGTPGNDRGNRRDPTGARQRQQLVELGYPPGLSWLQQNPPTRPPMMPSLFEPSMDLRTYHAGNIAAPPPEEFLTMQAAYSTSGSDTSVGGGDVGYVMPPEFNIGSDSNGNNRSGTPIPTATDDNTSNNAGSGTTTTTTTTNQDTGIDHPLRTP